MFEMFLAAPAPTPELSEVSDISVSGDASACMSSEMLVQGTRNAKVL